MDVHVRDLRYFAAVARELSFTRAAERLYVSQPALSKQIRALVIGMHTSPGRGVLPRVRAMMVASCPEVGLELRQIAWSDPTGGLATHVTDAAFVWLPLVHPPYRWVTIAREPRLVALPKTHPVRIAAQINDTEETYEAVASGIGICLLAAGNAPIFDRGELTMLPVRDLGPSELVLAWHERRSPPLLETFARLCAEVAGELAGARAA